jgi:L-amino acid N-acyltransferase YncA
MVILSAPIVHRDVTLPCRMATPADVAAIKALMITVYEFEPDMAAPLADKFFSTGYALLASFVAERARGVGLAAASIISGAPGPQSPVLEHIFTHPDERGQGWGGAVVQSSMNTLHDLGCRALTASATTANDGIGTIHRRFGFVRQGSPIYVATLPGMQ